MAKSLESRRARTYQHQLFIFFFQCAAVVVLLFGGGVRKVKTALAKAPI